MKKLWCELRPEPNGKFDELWAQNCDVHMEMMDGNCLWIGVYPRGKDKAKSRMVVWIRAKKDLEINAFEDG